MLYICLLFTDQTTHIELHPSCNALSYIYRCLMFARCLNIKFLVSILFAPSVPYVCATKPSLYIYNLRFFRKTHTQPE